MSEIEIHTFTQQYADDVTKLYRQHYLSNVAILFRASRAPFLYVSGAVMTVFLMWIWPNMWLSAAIFAAVIISCFIVISTCYVSVYCRERFDGRKCPAKLLATDNETFLVALDTSMIPPQLVGTVGVKQRSKDLAYLALLVIDKNFRRKGVSKRLLGKAIDHCISKGFTAVQADVWGLGNVFSVRGMFEKNGFVETRSFYGPSPFFPLIKAFTMKKML